MNQFITLLSAVEKKAIESKSEAKELFKLGAVPIINSLNYSNQQELKGLLHEHDLQIDDTHPSENQDLLCQLYVVMLVMVSFEGHLENKVATFCRETLDDNLEAWEHVQHNDWSFFAKNISKSVFRMMDNNLMRYYLISSSFRIGYTSNTIHHVARCNNSLVDLRILQAEAAQSVNQGRFNADIYDTPCFDVDGFISYPEAITEIDEGTFELYKEIFGEINYFDVQGDLCDQVRQYLEYVFEESDMTNA
jgi:hypothetical protein